MTAQRSRRKGVIIMQATVNADGLVEEVKILRADEDGFGIPEAAVAAAQKYRFKPGTKDGVEIQDLRHHHGALPVRRTRAETARKNEAGRKSPASRICSQP